MVEKTKNEGLDESEIRELESEMPEGGVPERVKIVAEKSLLKKLVERIEEKKESNRKRTESIGERAVLELVSDIRNQLDRAVTIGDEAMDTVEGLKEKLKEAEARVQSQEGLEKDREWIIREYIKEAGERGDQEAVLRALKDLMDEARPGVDRLQERLNAL